LPRFSQLIQRSLDGPLSSDQVDDTVLLQVVGYIQGSILPLKSKAIYATTQANLHKSRVETLKTLLGASTETVELVNASNKQLRQLECADTEALSLSLKTNCIVSRSPLEAPSDHPHLHNVSRNPGLHHPRLFGEASVLIGVSAASFWEHDLLIQFAGCDVTVIVRPVPGTTCRSQDI